MEVVLAALMMLCEDDLMCKTRTQLCIENFEETKVVNYQVKSKVFQHCFDQGFTLKSEEEWKDF